MMRQVAQLRADRPNEKPTETACALQLHTILVLSMPAADAAAVTRLTRLVGISINVHTEYCQDVFNWRARMCVDCEP